MDALFTWRRTQANDLAECLQLHPAKNGAEIAGDACLVKTWETLLRMSHATRSALVEMQWRGRIEVVGFGFASFVKKSFADAEVNNPRPGLNARIIKSVLSGDSVIATFAEVRNGNTVGDLQQVILETSWKHGVLTPPQVYEVRVLLALAYQELFSGYRLSRILGEMVDERDLGHISGQKEMRVVDRFEGFRRANPATSWNSDRCLIEITLETMRAAPHSIAAGLFQHHVSPECGFTQREQELLELAIDGADDASIANLLHLTLPAIKRRWSGIFERTASVRPDLCPLDGEGTRGIQKRQRILAYVRRHPEELRPFSRQQQTLGTR